MTAEKFAEWVAYMKEKHGLTSRQLAELLGCGVNQIRRWSDYGAPLYIGMAISYLLIIMNELESNPSVLEIPAA
jgi:hypothetical protein